MNLDEAITTLEDGMTVSDETGDLAPGGERWVHVTSGGLGAVSSYATDEETAAKAWLVVAWAYADKQAGDRLYWLERPTYREAEYLAVDQISLMQDPARRHEVMLRLGVVESRFAVSRKAEQKEGDK